MPETNIAELVSQMPELDNPAPQTRPAAEDEQGRRRRQQQDPALSKGKLTGPAWPDAAKTFEAILAGGASSVSAVIDLVKETDTNADYKPRYVLTGLAAYVARDENQRHRAPVIAGITSRLASIQSRNIRGFLIRTLEVFADASAASAIAAVLSDEELCDPAARALVSIGATEPLRAALPDATGRSRLAIIQALGQLKDAASIDALLTAAQSGDENVRITALWSLARTASPRAIGAIIDGANHLPPGWPRLQATRAAFLLAESLSAAGQKKEAAQIYQHLRDTRSEASESHIRDAAARGLGTVA
jgi:HEAT repeat protein